MKSLGTMFLVTGLAAALTLALGRPAAAEWSLGSLNPFGGSQSQKEPPSRSGRRMTAAQTQKASQPSLLAHPVDSITSTTKTAYTKTKQFLTPKPIKWPKLMGSSSSPTSAGSRSSSGSWLTSWWKSKPERPKDLTPNEFLSRPAP